MHSNWSFKPRFLGDISRRLNNLTERRAWVEKQLAGIPSGCSILDAGCGSQQYRDLCDHLEYSSQDFGGYQTDAKTSLGKQDTPDLYQYGQLDYVGNIWNIDAADNTFDAILCTEVLEHIPYPNDTVAELSRLIKPGGKLILTAPSNALRHMDPYFFYSGFSDRWFERILPENNLEIEEITPVGDYYSWLAAELLRSIKNGGLLTKLVLTPSLFYFLWQEKNKLSIDTLCMGYHILAKKRL